MTPRYRVWIKEEKCFADYIETIRYYAKEIVLCRGGICEMDCFDFEDVIFTQSTGFKDKNGKEIFEGDILYGYDGDDFWEIVEFDTEEGKWIRKDIWYNSKLGLSENNKFMEIVGNIYENPELLEVEQ